MYTYGHCKFLKYLKTIVFLHMHALAYTISVATMKDVLCVLI